MSDTPQPQAAKLPNTYDAALLGATVSTVTSDQFAYSLKTLLGLVMLERQCQAPEARQIILAEMIKPYSGMVTFVNDELLEEPVVVDDSPKIIVPKKLGNRRWG